MKIRQKILNVIFVLVIIFSTLVFTGVGVIAMEPQSKPDLNLQSRVGLLTHQHNTDNILIAALPQTSSTIPEKNAYAMEHMQKTGFKYALFKFLIAMLGVLLSSLALFAGLKLYKKFVLQNNTKSAKIDYETFESPKDFKEAINLFLNKTKK